MCEFFKDPCNPLWYSSLIGPKTDVVKIEPKKEVYRTSAIFIVIAWTSRGYNDILLSKNPALRPKIH